MRATRSLTGSVCPAEGICHSMHSKSADAREGSQSDKFGRHLISKMMPGNYMDARQIGSASLQITKALCQIGHPCIFATHPALRWKRGCSADRTTSESVKRGQAPRKRHIECSCNAESRHSVDRSQLRIVIYINIMKIQQSCHLTMARI